MAEVVRVTVTKRLPLVAMLELLGKPNPETTGLGRAKHHQTIPPHLRARMPPARRPPLKPTRAT
eukprot:11184988-Lingulodinium_polyedra.AAC.1